MIKDLKQKCLVPNLGSKKDLLAFQWRERYKVAMGVAEALDYLHNSASQPVIHRDVKSSNILLSDDFEPQLSDFGLARWASISTTHIVCSDVAGTFGYGRVLFFNKLMFLESSWLILVFILMQLLGSRVLHVW